MMRNNAVSDSYEINTRWHFTTCTTSFTHWW